MASDLIKTAWPGRNDIKIALVIEPTGNLVKDQPDKANTSL
jgi:hypothetical protein